MMRKLHRWLGLITGIFMALIALTGVTMQVIDLVSPEPPGAHFQGPPPAGAPAGDFHPGQGPDQGPGHGMPLRVVIDHIHDGEFIGNTGRVLSLVFGLSLLFFSVSGIWMYFKMLTARANSGRRELFW